MDKKQTKQHASNKLLVKEATNDPESLELVPSFKKNINRLGILNAEIDSLSIQQEKNLVGITIDKKNVRLKLIDWMVEIGGAVHSNAHQNGDHILTCKVDYKQSVIKRMDQPELLSVAGVILEEAQHIPPKDLLEQGITPEDLATLQSLIEEFNDIQSSPKEAVIDRSGTTEKISTLFAEAREIVKNSLDKLAPQYKRKAPEFYRRYKAARGLSSQSKKSPKTEPVVAPEELVVR